MRLFIAGFLVAFLPMLGALVVLHRYWTRVAKAQDEYIEGMRKARDYWYDKLSALRDSTASHSEKL